MANVAKMAASMPWNSQKRVAGCHTSWTCTPCASTHWGAFELVGQSAGRLSTVCPVRSMTPWLMIQSPVKA